MPDAFTLWPLAAFAVSLYCLARGAIDLRRRSLIWGMLGILAGLLLLLLPLQSHAVKYDVPPAAHPGQAR
jgi:hypothetical protein